MVLRSDSLYGVGWLWSTQSLYLYERSTLQICHVHIQLAGFPSSELEKVLAWKHHTRNATLHSGRLAMFLIDGTVLHRSQRNDSRNDQVSSDEISFVLPVITAAR